MQEKEPYGKVGGIVNLNIVLPVLFIDAGRPSLRNAMPRENRLAFRLYPEDVLRAKTQHIGGNQFLDSEQARAFACFVFDIVNRQDQISARL